MKKIFTIVLFSIFTITVSTAQNTYELTLEQSLEIARDQSYSMQSLKEDLIIAENNLKASIALLRTRVSLDLTLPQYTKTVREWEDSEGISFFSVETLRNSAGLSVVQPLPTDGNISIQGGLAGVEDFNTNKRAMTLTTRISLDQPINAFYGYNDIKARLKTARLDYDRAIKSIKREELDLVYNVSYAYYRLLQNQKSTEIALLDLERQKDAFKMSQDKFKAGLIREVEALQMEVDLADAQNNYDIAVLDQNSAVNEFKLLLGLELQDQVSLVNELQYDVVIIDPEKAVDYALANRLEIQERDIQIELQNITIKRTKAQGQPDISLQAMFERIGISNDDVPISYPNSIGNSWHDFNRRPSNYQVGLRFSIPIIDWGRNRSLVRSAQARLRQNILAKDNEERNVETEVRSLVARLQTYLNSLQILEKNVAVAEKSFNITLQRFTDGDIDSQALALERNRLNQAYRSHLNAFTLYQLGLADLTRKTFYDFRSDIPVN